MLFAPLFCPPGPVHAMSDGRGSSHLNGLSAGHLDDQSKVTMLVKHHSNWCQSEHIFFFSPDDHISQAQPSLINWPFCWLPIWLRVAGKMGCHPRGTNCFSPLINGLRYVCLMSRLEILCPLGASVHKNLFVSSKKIK